MGDESRARVLVVDDEKNICEMLARHLERKKLAVRTAYSVAEARTLLEQESVDLLITDYFIATETCDELARWALSEHRAASAVCMSGAATPKQVVAAMRVGCIDVLQKPFDFSDLDPIIEPLRVTEGRELATWRRMHAPDIIGSHPLLLEQLELMRNVADTGATVLIEGETGTGKELVARAIHTGSPRRAGPFVAINCAAIPETLIEDELFGHARGAFSGAVGARDGRILSANGGTLFLDEIGDMPLAAQAKLLRVLEERAVVPIGGDQPIPFDARIVAATNRNLEAMAEAQTFRADLLFRLSVVVIPTPALRDRADDIIPLAEHFMAKANRATGRQVTGFDPEAKAGLLEHGWSGNVRALANVIERAVIMKRTGMIGVNDLGLKPRARAFSSTPPKPVAPAAPLPAVAPTPVEPRSMNLREAIERVEREMIESALEKTNGNRTEAAALLGLNRTTLVEKLRKTSNG